MSAQLGLPGMDLPRRNGELAFDAPWQNRVFALAAAVVEHAFGGDREPFRRQLIKAIATEPGRPYWESWTAALEALVKTLGQAAADEQIGAVAAERGVEDLAYPGPGRVSGAPVRRSD